MSDTRVKCGNCKGHHATAADVKACYYPPLIKLCLKLEPHATHSDPTRNLTCPGFSAPVATAEQSVLWRGTRYVSNGCTQKQMEYIADLNNGDPDQCWHLTMKGASLRIDRLKRDRIKRPSVIEDAPNRRQTKIPLPMLYSLKDGYYATRADSTRPYTFFRVSRPKGGQFKGAFKVQTQHGPELMLALVIYPDDRIYWHNMAVEEQLLLVVVDPNGSAIAYADEIGNCMRCNTALTDERSRWFGIGPECEKHWPHIIDLVSDRKGPFVPGWERNAS